MAAPMSEFAVAVAEELDGVDEDKVDAPALARRGAPSLWKNVVRSRKAPASAAVVCELGVDAAEVVVVARDDVEQQILERLLRPIHVLEGLLEARGGAGPHAGLVEVVPQHEDAVHSERLCNLAHADRRLGLAARRRVLVAVAAPVANGQETWPGAHARRGHRRRSWRRRTRVRRCRAPLEEHSRGQHQGQAGLPAAGGGRGSHGSREEAKPTGGCKAPEQSLSQIGLS
mmetsp:Transcript_171313/g.416535  ORF Transcript_171313/g.416535 Transcript_171313/m.416535 type:complete len:229 (+) Transcript_171313:639-1325(+)